MDLYIYYRVACGRAGEVQKRVSAMHESLARKTGIAAQLKRRPQAQNGQDTWMEVYAGVPDGFDEILAHAVADAGLGELIDGERHTEVFVDVTGSPCA